MSASHRWLTCSLCSYQFDPQQHPACHACPLKRECEMVCCPACGFRMVDPQHSPLARLAERFLAGMTKPSSTIQKQEVI